MQTTRNFLQFLKLSRLYQRKMKELLSSCCSDPGQPPKPDDIIKIDQDIIELIDVDYQSFHDAISSKIWTSVGRANWQPFENARKFARGLRLKRQVDWYAYAKSREKHLIFLTTRMTPIKKNLLVG